ncbi:MAG: hypothetical protein J7641_06025 [Cyanobacteria bacterium SID2]|nr:hypothetical protein [Cyanobacteria bacterium SID2]MBP0006745.1 hypothetical protein [Cyanobacteria bacterium SBC]
MERGLMWLPLLALFIGLAWAGWNEFQKVEAYRRWAQGFDRAKYDILAVLGQKDTSIVWGKPTRQGILDLQRFSLSEVEEIRLLVDETVVDGYDLPKKSRSCALEFVFSEDKPSMKVPFTDVELAAKWGQALRSIDRASE